MHLTKCLVFLLENSETILRSLKKEQSKIVSVLYERETVPCHTVVLNYLMYRSGVVTVLFPTHAKMTLD